MDDNFLKAIEECKRIKKKALSEQSGGTVYPGTVALNMCPDVLKRVASDVPAILITGTNGKTTAARMLGNILASKGIPYIANREGANKLEGIAGSFITRTDSNGLLKEKIAVVECDEEFVPVMMEQLNAFCLVILDLSKGDQPYRFSSDDVIMNLLRKAIEQNPDVTYLFNSEDEGCRALYDNISCNKLFFKEEDFKGELRYLPDSIYRMDAAGVISAIPIINDKLGLGIDPGEVEKAICETKPAFGRSSIIRIGDNEFQMELIKNNANLERVKRMLSQRKGRPDLIIASDYCPELIWMRKFDWKGLIELVDNLYVWGDTVETDYFADTWGAIRIGDNSALEKFLLGTKNDTLLLFEYEACIGIWEYFAKRGYIEHYWMN